MTGIDLVLARQTIPPKWTGCLSPEEAIIAISVAVVTAGTGVAAMAGAATASATGGGVVATAMGSAAAGGFASELASDVVGHTDLDKETQTQVSGLVGGVAGLIATGDAAGVYTGQGAGESVFANNYLLHAEAFQLDKELTNCKDKSSCQGVLDKYKALSDEHSEDLKAVCAKSPLTCTAFYQDLVADGLKATEVPDWVPLTDSMSNNQAIDFVKQANGEDLHYIDTHSSTVDKLSTVISDPETQLGLLSGAVAVKDLTAVLSNGAKNLFGNAEKVVVSEVSTAASASAEVGEGTVLVGDVVPKSGGKIPWGSWSDYKKVNVDGQDYAQVGNRLYSEHSVNRIQPGLRRHSSSCQTGGLPEIYQAGTHGDYGRGVAPQFVEDAISSAKPVLQQNGNLSYTSGSIQVITNQQGAVVTIITH